MIRSITLFMMLTVSVVQSFSQELTIALVQSAFAWGDVEQNLSNFEDKISKIEGSDMIILPELFPSGCDMQKRDREVKRAEKVAVAAIYHQIVERMQRWAKLSGAVVVGSTTYQEDDRFYNRLLAVYPTGEYYHYDKHNCFKMGSYTAGDDHLVIDVKGHRFATYICYDLRFSEWSRNNDRYDSAIYIANWPESRADDWDQLLSERAAENDSYVIGVNCVGTDLGGTTFMGNSALYGPDGEVISSCESNREEILIVKY